MVRLGTDGKDSGEEVVVVCLEPTGSQAQPTPPPRSRSRGCPFMPPPPPSSLSAL